MNLPLSGKRVVVTRPQHQAGDLAERLKALGAEPILVPAIQVSPPADWKPIDQAINNLQQFNWVVFTSANGVESFVSRMRELGVEVRNLSNCKLAAIGPATASVLAKYIREPDFIPSVFISDAIAEELGEVKGQKVLLARADIARKDLAVILKEKGAEVTQVAVYRVEGNIDDRIQEELKGYVGQTPPDFITLTSPSAARGLLRILEEAGLEKWMGLSALICIGPITGKAVEEMGFKPTRIAQEHTTDGLVQAILEEAREVGSSRAN
jgi:uroporphyrinogen-III synthase